MEQTKDAMSVHPNTNPMNLTCAPVQTDGSPATGTVQYCVVIVANGDAQPPDGTWTPLPGFDPGNVTYVVHGTDFHGNSGHVDISGVGIGVYTKST
jgi:hypothetical protein